MRATMVMGAAWLVDAVDMLLLVCGLFVAGCSGAPQTLTSPSSADTAGPAPTISRTRFLACGDSITLGEITVPVSVSPSWPTLGQTPSLRLVVVPAASYPSQLQMQLVTQYPSQASSIAVINSGVGGEHAHEGAARFSGACEAAQPQVVLLMEGFNDLGLYGTDLPTLALRNMTIESHRRGARVFVSTMLPSRPGGRLTLPVSRLEEMNAKLKAMASEEGAVLVNLYDTLLPEANAIIGIDGLHPTEAGYRRIADLFFAAIRTELEVR
jgi:lysophospholipase L1-like esterase